MTEQGETVAPGASARELEALVREATAAARTLQRMGYTYTDGAELWRPPVTHRKRDFMTAYVLARAGAVGGAYGGLSGVAAAKEAAKTWDAIEAASKGVSQ